MDIRLIYVNSEQMEIDVKRFNNMEDAKTEMKGQFQRVKAEYEDEFLEDLRDGECFNSSAYINDDKYNIRHRWVIA